MAGSVHEKKLAAELLVVMFAQTADALSGANTGTFSLPDPSRYFAAMIVFTMLAGAAMFGEHAGKLAATFGGVASLAILLAPTTKSVAAGKPEPLVMSVLNYFNQIISGGVQNPAGGTSGAPTGPGQFSNNPGTYGTASGQVPAVNQGPGGSAFYPGGSSGAGVTQTPPGQVIN